MAFDSSDRPRSYLLTLTACSSGVDTSAFEVQLKNEKLNKLSESKSHGFLSMTNLEGKPTNMKNRLLSSDRLVFAVVCATIVSVVIETGVIRVSGFVGISDVGTNVKTFVVLGIVCICSQLIILNFVHNKVGKSFLFPERLHMKIVNKAIMIIQFGIIALLIATLFEVSLILSYDVVLLEAVIVSSFLTAAYLTALMSLRLIIWFKSNKNRVMLAYLLASLFISVSAIIGIVYLLDQLSYQPAVSYARQYGDYLEHVDRGYSSLLYPYSISSAVAFVLLWIGTVFLLLSYRKRLGTKKYWIIMSIPLFYFLSQFQPVILNLVLNYASDNPMFFNLVYVVMVDVSRPMGGILFGLAFILVARKLESQEVKGYLVVSGVGFLLLLVSYQAVALTTAPFPPLGLLSASYFGLSSFLIFIGLYSSAVSISQDSRLRVSIRRSVETELKFIGSVGEAEMDHRILEKVLSTSKKISETLPEESGISSSLTDKEIKDYIQEVLAETKDKQSLNGQQ